MTLANQLTLARAVLGLMTFACLLARSPGAYVAASILYVAATLTDWVDGWIARKTHSVSAFGAVADPVADKILVIGALIAFLRIHSLQIPHWAVFLVVVREFVVLGVRALAGTHGKVLVAERWGKWKMGVQSGSVMAILAYLVLRDVLRVPLPVWLFSAPWYLVLLVTLVTWASAVLYLRQNLPLLRKSWNPTPPSTPAPRTRA